MLPPGTYQVCRALRDPLSLCRLKATVSRGGTYESPPVCTHLSAVLADRRVDQCAAQRAQPSERAGIVEADQPTVADHVGVDDGN